MEIRMDNPELVMVPPGYMLAQIKEREGSRHLMLTLNELSFQNLAIALNEVATPRPTVHKTVANCIQALGGNIEKVVIDEYINDVYRSHIFLKDERSGKTVPVDIHVTDALVVAVLEHCPIFVEEDIFEKIRIARENEANNSGARAAEAMLNNIDWDNLPKD